MPKTHLTDEKLTTGIAKGMMQIIPTIRKKLLYIDILQDEFNLTLSHIQVLVTLDYSGTVPVGDISKRLGIAKPNVTPLIDKLIKMGYVSRKRDVNDRRIVQVTLTADGNVALEKMQTLIAEQMRDWIGELSLAEARELEQSLSCIARIFSLIG